MWLPVGHVVWQKVNMVHSCCVVGCTNRSFKGSSKRFFRFPKVISHQGPQTEKLLEKRRTAWLSRVDRKDWTPSCHHMVCSDHFINGKRCKLIALT